MKISSSMGYHAKKFSQDLLTLVESQITNFQHNINFIADELFYDGKIYAVLTSEGKKKIHDNNHIGPLKEYLKRRIGAFAELQSIAVLALDNSIVLSVNSEDKRVNIQLENLLRRKIYNLSGSTDRQIDDILLTIILKDLIAQGKNSGGQWYLFPKGENEYLFYTRNISDRDSYDDIGFLIVMVNLEYLKESYESLLSDMFENVLISTQSGNIIFRNTGFLPIDNYIGIIKTKERLSGSFYSDDKKLLFSYRKLINPDWYIISSVRTETLIRDFLNLRSWLLRVLVPLLLLLSFLSIMTALDIVNPIQLLVGKMRNFKAGGEYLSLQLQRRDELGILADHFNQMAAEINNLLKNIYQEQLTRKEAELKALQSQINPHFLFNTLEALSWKARLKDAPELSEMIIALSALLEAAISRDTKLISLKEEMRYVENYISIMRIRYQDKFSIEWNLDHTLLSIRVPHLLLQPIIENAFKHGIIKSQHRGIIEITTRKDGELIVIEITDNGLGLSPDQAEKINKQLNEEFPWEKQQSRISIGLVNVNRRLKLFFGNDYGLNLYSDKEKKTRAVIIIPDVRGKKL